MVANVSPHHATADTTLLYQMRFLHPGDLYRDVRAVERMQLITSNIASRTPAPMSARRGAACYALAKFFINNVLRLTILFLLIYCSSKVGARPGSVRKRAIESTANHNMVA